MSSTPPAEQPAHDTRPHDRDIPAFVDWLLGAFFAILGFVAIFVGAGVFSMIDRSEIREAVAEEAIVVEGLSDPETVDMTQALANWAAFGLIATGIVLVLAGIGYVLMRRRTHRRAAAGEPVSHYGANALLGALVTIVVSFVPFSQVLGGLVAGYLEQTESERTASVGAASGVLSTVPAVVVLLFVTGGAASGFLAIGEGGAALVSVALALLGVSFIVLLGGGLGAIGGHLGGQFAKDDSSPDDHAEPRA
ncbi:DUF5518 domain-containing protein [Salinarchaeum laminariae]|uniref:DUF5518 domain-containing protein n=1 Tax=Salinarchaeum laminariae TaxID=869888 RepID=UPI0020BDB907|nr:DUF5518 domain-containing protein [Salinarchaeum laminariae]